MENQTEQQLKQLDLFVSDNLGSICREMMQFWQKGDLDGLLTISQAKKILTNSSFTARQIVFVQSAIEKAAVKAVADTF
jgi:hypothetical protein